LIVSCTGKSITFLTEVLNSFSLNKIVTATSCSGARQLLLEQDFDLVIINAPLHDESGESLSRHVASKGISQVILIVKSDYYDEVSHIVEDYGVITIAKPVNKNLFWSALKLAKAAGNKLKTMQAENDKLTKKIEDIRIVDRAKCILISYLNMRENEAHKYIEKQAMDMRITKRDVAEGILKTYEN
jgi:AmiR/NasT family two-component response regulator